MIRFDHITKQYPGTNKPALNSIELEILRGEFVFLVGASGSGKSSCLRLVLKEEKPTSGRIHVLGQDLRSISNRKVPYFRRNLGVVFQDFRLLPNKSVYDNVAFSLQVIGKSRGFIQEAVPDTLEMVGLAEKAQRLPHELSGGEQQRVAIARAIVNKPQILLADEPTGNLDPTTSAGIMALLARINEGGTTVVMATHEAGIVDQMKRRVVELSGGQIVRDEREGGYKTSAIPVQKPETVVVPPAAPVRVAGPESDPEPDRQPPVRPEPESQAQPVSQPRPATPTAVPASTPAVPASSPAVAHSTPVLPATAAVDVPAAAFGPGAAQAPAPSPEPARSPVPARAPASGDETAPVSSPAPAAATLPAAVAEDPQEHVAEQLTLAEKLGLRAPGERPDHTGEQNVGPTR